ncbi:MAG: hypothetical protein AAF625_20005, partial [Pseudomonadota bacterium]
MRSVHHPKWTMAKRLGTLLFAGLVTGGPAPGADLPLPVDLQDVHLNIIPRTPEENARIAAVTAAPQQFDAPQRFEELSAGAATVRVRNDADAFSQPSGNLSFEQELDFKVGNGLFKKIWVSSPSSTLAS